MENAVENPDTVGTKPRAAIRELYDRLCITPCLGLQDFRCPHLPECSPKPGRSDVPFHTGTWPYIGACYGQARVLGNLIRILFVAMERGGQYNPAEEPTFSDTQWAFRDSAENRRNPHMGGASQLMEYLVEDKVPDVYSTQFALTNAVKCVEYTKRMNSTSTPTMIRNCAEHLRVEITLLQPHLIVTQGRHPTNTVQQLFPGLTPVAEFVGDAGRSAVLVGKRFVVLTTPHPARKIGWRWKRGPLPTFLQDAVRRAQEVRK